MIDPKEFIYRTRIGSDEDISKTIGFVNLHFDVDLEVMFQTATKRPIAQRSGIDPDLTCEFCQCIFEGHIRLEIKYKHQEIFKMNFARRTADQYSKVGFRMESYNKYHKTVAKNEINKYWVLI